MQKCNVNILSTLLILKALAEFLNFMPHQKDILHLVITLDTKDKLYLFDTKLQCGHFLPGIALSSSVEPSETEGRRGE